MRARSFVAGLALCATAVISHAKECLLIPDVSLCGVPLSSPQPSFEQRFGEPDARVNMGNDRVGLLYGTNLVVIFWHGKIWEIQNWERFRSGPHDWQGYVGFGRQDRETKIVFPGWNPWKEQSPKDAVSRREMPEHAGDENSDVRIMKGGSVFVLFPELEPSAPHENAKIVFMRINLEQRSAMERARINASKSSTH